LTALSCEHFEERGSGLDPTLFLRFLTPPRFWYKSKVAIPDRRNCVGNKEIGMIKTFGENVEKFAGKTVRAKVMSGSERITPKTSAAELAAWMKGATDRMDKLVSREKRAEIRRACGRACAVSNRRMLEGAKAKRKKFPSLEKYLESEMRKPLAGTRLKKDGNVLYWFFTPRSFSPRMTCFCVLMRGLPGDEMVSPTYCLCSRGFVEEYWKNVLGKPVKVGLLGSCLTGSQECKFAISF
jgi:hypothetical protein